MRVRSFLPLRIHARSAVLDEGRSLSQAAVFLYGQRREATRPIIRNKQVLTRFVDQYMTRAAAARRHSIQQCQLTALRLDAERAPRSRFLPVIGIHFADCVNELAIGMNGEERRPCDLSRESD